MSIATNGGTTTPSTTPLFNRINGGGPLKINHSINNGQPKSVPCSFLRTNTNIYYNIKVDNSAKKSVHYCLTCSNYNCKSIHKSICKSLDHHHPQQTRLSLNKTSSNGPNINFIFERRYPTTATTTTSHQHQQQHSNQTTSIQVPPNKQNKQINELNSFPLPSSSQQPILTIDNDFLNLLNLPRSFRNNLLLIDQVRKSAWNTPPLLQLSSPLNQFL